MKKIILRLLRMMSVPVKANNTVYMLLKDEFLCNSAEHLVRLKKLISRRNIEVKGKIILDIGAASGDSTPYFAKYFPACKVIGFEPIPAAFETARNHTASISSIELRNIALYDHPGEMKFFVTENLLSSSLHAPITREGKEVEVKVSTIDHEVAAEQPVLFMKLDTQGTELKVLQGGLRTQIKTDFLLVELNNHHDFENSCQYFEVDEFLRNQNFQLADIIVTYRSNGLVAEHDAIYLNKNSQR